MRRDFTPPLILFCEMCKLFRMFFVIFLMFLSGCKTVANIEIIFNIPVVHLRNK